MSLLVISASDPHTSRFGEHCQPIDCPLAAQTADAHTAAATGASAAERSAVQLRAFQAEAREALGFLCAADRSRRAHAVRTICHALVVAHSTLTLILKVVLVCRGSV